MTVRRHVRALSGEMGSTTDVSTPEDAIHALMQVQARRGRKRGHDARQRVLGLDQMSARLGMMI